MSDEVNEVKQPRTEWQERVIKEEEELDLKVEALHNFTNSEAFNALDARNRELLLQQGKAMCDYSLALKARIELF